MKQKALSMFFWSVLFVLLVVGIGFHEELTHKVATILVLIYLLYRMGLAIWNVISGAP